MWSAILTVLPATEHYQIFVFLVGLINISQEEILALVIQDLHNQEITASAMHQNSSTLLSLGVRHVIAATIHVVIALVYQPTVQLAIQEIISLL